MSEHHQLSSAQSALIRLKTHINQEIIGQEVLVERMLIGLLADGHILVEGAPGLAKTRAINVLSKGIQGDFHRVQFTPDLLPADLTGTEIYRPQQGTFEFQKGPLFHNLILADEINRSPAKVQAALLEAMAERQITVGQATYPLPQLFMVMATQNPIEQEGTYPLPEAQLDRFLLHVKVDYPNAEHEKNILHLARSEAKADAAKLKPVLRIICCKSYWRLAIPAFMEKTSRVGCNTAQAPGRASLSTAVLKPKRGCRKGISSARKIFRNWLTMCSAIA
jgi:MoxR-like ATPase